MSLIIQCSSGHRMTVADEYKGKRVRCPQCQEILTVPAGESGPMPAPPAPMPAAPRPPQDYGVQAPPAPGPMGYDGGGRRGPNERREFDEHRDRERWDDGDDPRERDYAGDDRDRDYRTAASDGPLDRDEIQQLQTVSLGLAFSFYRYLLSVIVLVLAALLFILLVIVETQRFRRPSDTLQVLAIVDVIIMGIVGLVAVIFMFVGTGLCCRAPARAGGAALPVVSVILDGVAFLAYIVFTILLIATEGGRRDGGPVLFIIMLFAALLALTAQALLNAFWYRLGNFLGDRATARFAIGTMIAWLCGHVLSALLLFLLGVIGASSRGPDPTIPILLLVGAGIWIVLTIVLMCLFMAVISKLRARIRNEARGGGYR